VAEADGGTLAVGEPEQDLAKALYEAIVTTG
jgi:hypothetical protein